MVHWSGPRGELVVYFPFPWTEKGILQRRFSWDRSSLYMLVVDGCLQSFDFDVLPIYIL